MCKVIEDMRSEVARETAWRTKVEAVRGLLKTSLSHDEIANALELTIEQVKEIAGEKSA